MPRFLKREAASVEIHWNICWPSRDASVNASELWRRAVPIRLPSGEALGLCAEDLFLHLCLHASRQHQFEFGLRPLCDIGQVVRCYGDRFAWPEMVERARRWRCTRDVYLALRLARDLLGPEVPDEIFQDLRPVVFDETLIMTARRQVFSDRRTSDSVPASFVEFWDDRRMVGRVRTAFGIIFRPKEILLEQYALPADSRRVYLYYAVRLKDLLSRHGRFALNLLRRQPHTIAAVRRKAILREWLAGEWVDTEDGAPRFLRGRQ